MTVTVLVGLLSLAGHEDFMTRAVATFSPSGTSCVRLGRARTATVVTHNVTQATQAVVKCGRSKRAMAGNTRSETGIPH